MALTNGMLSGIKLRKAPARSFACKKRRESFEMSFIRKFAPRHFDCFDFIPSVGASGGILVLWNSANFKGVVLDKKSFGITLNFASVDNNENWKLTNVYGPCTEPARTDCQLVQKP